MRSGARTATGCRRTHVADLKQGVGATVRRQEEISDTIGVESPARISSTRSANGATI